MEDGTVLVKDRDQFGKLVAALGKFKNSIHVLAYLMNKQRNLKWQHLLKSILTPKFLKKHKP